MDLTWILFFLSQVAIQSDIACRQFTFCVDGERSEADPLSCGAGTRFNRDTGD